MLDRSALLNAPPRLSDLHGDARTRALVDRYRSHTADWLEARTRRTLGQRIADLLR